MSRAFESTSKPQVQFSRRQQLEQMRHGPAAVARVIPGGEWKEKRFPLTLTTLIQPIRRFDRRQRNIARYNVKNRFTYHKRTVNPVLALCASRSVLRPPPPPCVIRKVVLLLYDVADKHRPLPVSTRTRRFLRVWQKKSTAIHITISTRWPNALSIVVLSKYPRLAHTADIKPNVLTHDIILLQWSPKSNGN